MTTLRLFTSILFALASAGCGSEKAAEPASSAPNTTPPMVLSVTDAQTPPATTAPEPTPAAIDALLTITAADNFEEMGPQNDLWTAIFQLKQWHLLTFPNSKSSPPGLNIETHEGKKWVMAFTDTDRLHEYAKLRNQLNADESMLGMSVPSRTSFDFFEGLQEIEGVRFNEGEVGWFAPMGNLRAIHEHLVKLGRLQPAMTLMPQPSSAPLVPLQAK